MQLFKMALTTVSDVLASNQMANVSQDADAEDESQGLLARGGQQRYSESL